MAVKIKRKRPEEEVQEEEVVVDDADQILTATEDTFDFLTENRNAILGGIGALILVVIAGSLMNDNRAASKATEAREVLVALDALVAPTGEEADIASTRERAALAASSAAGARENFDAPLSAVAAGIEAPAALQSGDAARAAQAYSDYRAANEGFADAQLAGFGQASALAASGDLEGAIAVLERVGTTDGFDFSAALHGARLVDAFGAPNDALTRYRAVAAEFSDEASRANVDHRVTQLEIQLGEEPVEAEAADDAPADDADGE